MYDTVMALIADQAVVLAKVDYSETSQVIVFFTREHGKVRAIAKGIKRGTKKRFAVGIDLLDVGHVVVSSRRERGAALATVTEWKQTTANAGLREKLFRIYGAQYVVEITAGLTEDWDPHIELFNALMATLRQLCEVSEPLTSVVRFQLALLDSIGSLPRFESCVQCRRREDLLVFSSFEGGMVCKHCEPGQVEKRHVSPATLERLWDLHSATEGASPQATAPHTGLDPTVDVSDVGAGSHALGRPGRASSNPNVQSDYVGPFDLLDYHISHLMGRAPRMASKLVSVQMRSRTGGG